MKLLTSSAFTSLATVTTRAATAMASKLNMTLKTRVASGEDLRILKQLGVV